MRELPKTLHPPLETHRGASHRTRIGRLQPAALLAAGLFAATARPALAAPEPPAIHTNATLPKADGIGNHTGCPHASIPDPLTSPQRERPRTLAAAREQKNGLATNAVTDSVATYDAALVDAVQQRWHALLDHARIWPRPGNVVLEFNLHPDGRITDLRTADCQVGEFQGLLCQGAVLDPAPYAQWPSDMRRTLGTAQRAITVTFWHLVDDFDRPKSVVPQPLASLAFDLGYPAQTPTSRVRREPAREDGHNYDYGPGLAEWPRWYGGDLFRSSKSQRRLEKDLEFHRSTRSLPQL